ncbi:unnamed protein product [Alternaria sp. RS040]
MADPFSVTGSAVGVVSLAIQLCKGLERYVSGVKDAKDKAEKIAADTEELTNLLELLETIVAKVDPSQSVSTTLTGIASCAEAIATIRKKLKLDDQAANGGIKSSLKRLGKRMAFPFKEAEIEYWKGVLNTIQQSLQTALLALVIDQQRLAFEGTRLFYTQLSHLCSHAGELLGTYSRQPNIRNTDNLRYLVMVLLAQMPAEASETNDQGLTCVDEATLPYCPGRSANLADFVTTLLEHGLKITWQTVNDFAAASEESPAFVKIPFENYIDLLWKDNEFTEAILSKSDHQLWYALHQTGTLQNLDGATVTTALKIATANGWIEGCKTMLEADVMAYVDEESIMEKGWQSLLTCSRSAGSLDMVQFWLPLREKFERLSLRFIGYVEDLLYYDIIWKFFYSIELIRLLSIYLRSVRCEIKEERRIRGEDARLRDILEELVPMFSTQFDAVGGRLEDFVVDVMIPKMLEVAKELKEEDAALYAQGRRELGVVMYEDEDDAEQSESGEEQEKQDENTGEESDDEY